jgi:hypothetical protein
MFYHGTSLQSGLALLHGMPLSIAAAAAQKIDGPAGFYLASDRAAAAFFAARRTPDTILQYAMINRALNRLLAGGSTLGPIPQGIFRRRFPGDSLSSRRANFPNLIASGKLVRSPCHRIVDHRNSDVGYGPDDLVIIDDPIEVIRRNPTLYGGDRPRGARLAAAVARDLIQSGDIPVNIDLVAGWWLITCQKDWLSVDGRDNASHWSRMIPTPHFGPESIRAEVVLTALSRGLLTLSHGKIQWLTQEVDIPAELRGRLDKLLETKFSGRAVAFIAE